MTSTVLDASAFLAYLGNESGAQICQEAIAAGAYMSMVNWAEVLSKLCDRGEDVAKAVHSFRSSGLIGGAIELVPFTTDDAENVAMLRGKTKLLGLSLADRSCLALALRLKLPVVTCDRAWVRLRLAVPIRSIR